MEKICQSDTDCDSDHDVSVLGSCGQIKMDRRASVQLSFKDWRTAVEGCGQRRNMAPYHSHGV